MKQIVAKPKDRFEAWQWVVFGRTPMLRIDGELPEIPIATDVWEKISALKTNPQARRLLVYLHLRCCATHRLDGYHTPELLARIVWGHQRPKHWRTFLLHVITRTIAAARKGGWMLHRQPDAADGRIGLRLEPEFLGALQPLYSEKGLRLWKKFPPADTPVSNKAIAFLHDHGWDSSDYAPKELREMIRETRANQASQPTLANLAIGNAWRIIFVPAALGEPAVVKDLGPLVQLLVDQRTRWGHEVEDSMVAAARGSGKVRCDMLDPGTKYVCFAGNGGGRGYRVATWARWFHTSPSKFLAALARAAPRLGLTVVGIGVDTDFLDLAALQDGNPALWERINIRIYTPSDFRRRWAGIFGWKYLNDKPAGPSQERAEVKTDLAVVRQRAMFNGIRKTARAVGIDAGNLAHWLKTGTRLSDAMAMRVRKHLLTPAVPAPEEANEIFANCESLGDWAVAYSKMGFSVMPLVPGARKTYFKWRPFQTQRPTAEQLRIWWQVYPEASIGLILGPISGLRVADTDSEAAHERLREIVGDDVLETAWQVRSGSQKPGKMHYYFADDGQPSPSTTANRLFPQLEIRGTNGLIVAPPSLHWKSGLSYDWIEGHAPWQILLPPFPQVLKAALDEIYAPKTSSRPAPVRRTFASDGGFTESFSHLNGLKLPNAIQEFFQGKFAHAAGWNQRIFEAARWCRDHGVPENSATIYLLQGAAPVEGAEPKARATIRSAYSHTPLQLPR